MRKEFHEEYKRLYDEYLEEFWYNRISGLEYDLVRRIRNSIDSADKENTLRPDAKYFLIVNFHCLIVKPIVWQIYKINKNIPIADDIASDIVTIVSETMKYAGQEEISGHQIMRTIDKVWKDLKTTKFEIWG